jgi:hypothetical protein
MALLQALQDLLRPQIEQMSRVPDNTVASVQVPAPTPVQTFIPEMTPQQSTPDYQPQVSRVAGFPDIPAGGGRFVTEEDAKVWNSQTGTFEPKPEEPWYKRMVQDPAFFDRLALGFNTMRLNPDQQLASILGDRIKTASQIGRQNKTAERVAVELQNQGRFKEAAMVEANPEIAKDMLAALMKPTKSFLTLSGSQANKMLGSNVFKPDQAVKYEESTGEFSGIGSAGTKVDVKIDQGGAAQIKRAESITDRAMASPELMINAQNMLDLLDSGVQTGFGQEAMLDLKRLVQQINPDIDVGNVAGQEAFLAASTKAILPLVKQLGVNPTDTDLKFIASGSATLGKSVAGNKLMLKAILFKAQRDQALGEWANDWSIRNAQLIKSSGVEANARFNKELLGFMKTSPLFTQASQQLREEYNAIVSPRSQGSSTRSALQQGGFVTPAPTE